MLSPKIHGNSRPCNSIVRPISESFWAIKWFAWVTTVPCNSERSYRPAFFCLHGLPCAVGQSVRYFPQARDLTEKSHAAAHLAPNQFNYLWTNSRDHDTRV